MKTIPYQKKEEKEPIAVAIGKFETLHPGHMKLIDAVVTAASKLSVVPTVLSIERGDEAGVLSFDERERLLSESGIDLHLTCDFDERFMSLTAEQFVLDVLIKDLNVRHVVIGHDFRFGHKRAGDVSLLEKLSSEYGFGLTVIPEQTYEGKKLSSSGIREALTAGDVALAARMMGRFYSITGTVVEGKKLGRTLGFPTANLHPDLKVFLPAAGVYETRVLVGDKTFSGLTNVGTNPTVDSGDDVRIETHLLDFEGDIYGRKITVEFRSFIREERKFASTYELKNQMESDRMYVVGKVAHQ